VGAPCETNTVGIASGTIAHYLDDALDFKKDIHADDGTGINLGTLFFSKSGNFQNAIIRDITKKMTIQYTRKLLIRVSIT
jgi:hypothetical protein